MTGQTAVVFLVFGAVLGLLLWGRWRYDLVAFAGLVVAVIAGVVPEDEAFSGFGHPATMIVALVLVVSGGLVRSGAVQLLTRAFIDPRRALPAHIATMGGMGAVLSAFMNNVAALALLMPVDIQAARKAGRLPRLSLMPLSFATILGGMVTLIGTPPNIIVSGIRADRLGEPFAMFDFLPVGGAVATVGLLFVALVGWRLIPAAADDSAAPDPMAEVRAYVAELVVPEGAALVGTPIKPLREAAERDGVELLGVLRKDGTKVRVTASATFEPGDVLILEAAPDALEEFRSAHRLAASDKAWHQGTGGAPEIVEVVVPEGARIAGRSAERIGLGWRRGTVLLGISRRGRRVRERVRKTTIEPGDILLLLVPAGAVDDVVEWLRVLPLSDRGVRYTATGRTWLAIGVFAAAVVAASLGLVGLPVALGAVAVLYVVTGVLPISEIYEHIEWPVVVLLGSMIPLGHALEASGGTALLAGGLSALTAGLPGWAVLAVLMVLTMSLSDILNNTATAIVAAPLAIDLAEGLGHNPDPYLMAVAIAASCAFLTPIGHKNNTLVLGPGGYRFGDYWRMGLPLELLVIAVSVPLIPVVWPLG